ncbi:MAG: hypothetical protein LBL51_01245 [Synergistaceae bacterium]|jgi:predicted RNase H-like nuclease (RuvC/YqgF family)|nr:hypothetical protein [Synergistaceae bacterium]
MGRLEDIESAAERLKSRFGTLRAEREETRAELKKLRTAWMERDEETVRTAQLHAREMEDACEEVLDFERRWVRAESVRRNLNDRLSALVRPAGPDARGDGFP